jgi:pimeloyl-ACP methyl ester carboxylesterase
MIWLLLHGTPLSPEVWDGVREYLPADTWAPDLNALIDRAAPGRLQTRLQTDVAASLLSMLPGGELVVVGHSFGGQVALDVALLAPERVARLVIVCTRHTPFPAFADGARAVRDGRRVDIDGGLRRWFTAEELAAGGPVVDYVRSQLNTAARGPWAASLDAIATYDRSSEVGRIGAPVSLLAAGHDEVATPAVNAELESALPHAHLRVIAPWAHMSPFVDPAAFATRLTAVVQPLPSTP